VATAAILLGCYPFRIRFSDCDRFFACSRETIAAAFDVVPGSRQFSSDDDAPKLVIVTDLSAAEPAIGILPVGEAPGEVGTVNALIFPAAIQPDV